MVAKEWRISYSFSFSFSGVKLGVRGITYVSKIAQNANGNEHEVDKQHEVEDQLESLGTFLCGGRFVHLAVEVQRSHTGHQSVEGHHDFFELIMGGAWFGGGHC